MFKLTLTKAARISPAAFNPPLLTAARRFSKKMDKVLTLTVVSWEGEKPKFETQFTLDSKALVVQPTMTGSQKGIDKWGFLDEGTAVRYAILSRDWKSKTTPGFIGSGPGRGRVVKIDVNHPQPGIEARGWSVKISKELRPEWRRVMQAALAAGARRAERT